MKLKCLLVLSAVLQLNLALESQVIIVEEDVLIPNEFDFNITGKIYLDMVVRKFMGFFCFIKLEIKS